MKKIFILLALFIMPLGVNAEEDLEQIHNSISKTNELEVKSIPISYYKETKNYKTCISGNDGYFSEEQYSYNCLNFIYRSVINSYLNKTFELPEGYKFYLKECDFLDETCEISIGNEEKGRDEEYKIIFSSEYDEEIFQDASKFVDNLKKEYYLSDMSYINQLINYTGETGFFDSVIYNNFKILNIFPEFKSNLEKNPAYDYIPVTLGVGGSPIMYGSGAEIVVYQNDIAVGISEGFNYDTLKLVFVPNTTENTIEEYISVAKERIEEYLNDDSYEVSLVYDELYKQDYCSDEYSVCDVTRFLNKIFNDEEEYIATPFKLIINDNEYFVGIVPVEEENIIDLQIKSINYETNISIETNGSNVPLDTSLRVKDKSKEYGKHGYDRVYDISLYSLLKDGYITKIHNGVKVRIPLSDNYKQNKVDVYHIKENGEKEEKYNAKVIEIEGKKYAEFTTNHFSLYGIEGELPPKTYDKISVSIVLLLIGLTGMYITILSSKKTIKKYN